MKRLVFALAAAVLGSGCIVTNDSCDRTITTDWVDFTWYSASTWNVTGCAAAGVTGGVDVWMDGGYVGNYACGAGGVTITGVGDGSHNVTVEGLDSSGTVILYRDWFTVDASSCGDHYVAAHPAEGFINLSYTSDVGCGTSPCYLRYQVTDDMTGKVAYASNLWADPSTNGDPNFGPFPSGLYTVDWMEYVSSGNYVAAATCAPVPLTLNLASVADVPVDMYYSCRP